MDSKGIVCFFSMPLFKKKYKESVPSRDKGAKFLIHKWHKIQGAALF